MALSQANVQARLSSHFPGEEGRILLTLFTNAFADLQALKTWGDALAAKLNAEAAGGVATFDTNYTGPSITTTGL